MRILTGLAIITALGVATAAEAAPARLSDTAYMQASRCAGLASSGKLGGDAAALKTMLKGQSLGREAYVLEKADDMQRAAKREADRADDVMKARLSSELNGVCATLKG